MRDRAAERLEDLQHEARYPRERLELDKARLYGGRGRSQDKHRELERGSEGAAARLRRAEAEARRPPSGATPDNRGNDPSGHHGECTAEISYLICVRRLTSPRRREIWRRRTRDGSSATHTPGRRSAANTSASTRASTWSVLTFCVADRLQPPGMREHGTPLARQPRTRRSSIRRATLKRRDGDMRLRWTAAGLAEAQKGFRRVKGHRDLPELTAALRRELNPTPTEEAAAARPPDTLTRSGPQSKTYSGRDILQELGALRWERPAGGLRARGPSAPRRPGLAHGELMTMAGYAEQVPAHAASASA
jgi:hypothetical protein